MIASATKPRALQTAAAVAGGVAGGLPGERQVLAQRPGDQVLPFEVSELAGREAETAHRLAADMTGDQHARSDALIAAVIKQAEGFARDGVPAADAARVSDDG